jgi:hypothetical protein
MSQRSKFNESEIAVAKDELQQFLKHQVLDSKGLIESCRQIVKLYLDSGYDIMDQEIAEIIAIESETDNINVNDFINQSIYDMYIGFYKQGIYKIGKKIAKFENYRDTSNNP